MKLLVTDYDNTFHINDNDMDENVHAVRLFMDDNLFAIATGRNYTSFMEQKELYDIPFNYLITNNGATIIKNGDVICDCFIEDEIKNSILKTIDFSKIEKAIYCNGKDMVTQKEKLSKIYFKFYDKETAIKIAESVWYPIYGSEIYTELPFEAILEGDSVWFVHGNLTKGTQGGCAEIRIRKKDSSILYVAHQR